ncbi:MAG: hypothetical protein GF364_16280 [Candidatus Lokiarchaeota archaeon]|nr:hypothetical protein [Candidatus Lokiarchaeota archaeon]
MSDEFSSEVDINKVETNTRIKRIAKKYGKVQTVEVKKRDPFLPPKMEKELRESLPKMRAIIPTDLARKHDVRVSTLKKFLDDLTEEGLLELEFSNGRIKVYQGKDSK